MWVDICGKLCQIFFILSLDMQLKGRQLIYLSLLEIGTKTEFYL